MSPLLPPSTRDGRADPRLSAAGEASRHARSAAGPSGTKASETEGVVIAATGRELGPGTELHRSADGYVDGSPPAALLPRADREPDRLERADERRACRGALDASRPAHADARDPGRGTAEAGVRACDALPDVEAARPRRGIRVAGRVAVDARERAAREAAPVEDEGARVHHRAPLRGAVGRLGATPP